MRRDMSLAKTILVQACNRLNIGPQPKDTLAVLHNLASAELAVAVNPVDKSDRNLSDVIPKRSGARYHLHLKNVAFGLCNRNDVAEHRESIQSRGSRSRLGSCVVTTKGVELTGSFLSDQ